MSEVKKEDPQDKDTNPVESEFLPQPVSPADGVFLAWEQLYF